MALHSVIMWQWQKTALFCRVAGAYFYFILIVHSTIHKYMEIQHLSEYTHTKTTNLFNKLIDSSLLTLNLAFLCVRITSDFYSYIYFNIEHRFLIFILVCFFHICLFNDFFRSLYLSYYLCKYIEMIFGKFYFK